MDWSPVAAAAVAALPAWIVARRQRGTAEAEGQNTRTTVTDALNQAVGSLSGQIADVRSAVNSVEQWQAAHTTEHAVSALRPALARTRLEQRVNSPQTEDK